MKLDKFVLSLLFVAAIGLSGCKREKAPLLAATPPQVFVATVEPRDVPVIDEWIGRLDDSANVDIRARVQGYIQEIAFEEDPADIRFAACAISHELLLPYTVPCS
jgi:multidrug efflux pump subunit AcrA (membrane-fusion protein)